MITICLLLSVGLPEAMAQDAVQVAEGGDIGQKENRAPIDLESLQREVQKVRESVLSAVCATFCFDGPNHGVRAGSAVVISKEGQILTHAHHQPGLKPGDQMGITVGDGRKDLATVVGVDRLMDVTLLKMNSPGPWPAVAIGDSNDLKHSEPCIAFGFPLEYFSRHSAPESPTVAMMRLGQYVGRNDQCILSSCRMLGGDSGGPIFNLEGQLIGIHHGEMASVGGSLRSHVSTATFREIRQELERGMLREASPILKPLADVRTLPKIASRLPKSVVEVRSHGMVVCHGVVIDSSGLIITKASEVSGELTCRLSEGELVPALRLAVVPEHDLALLSIDRREMPAVDWHRLESIDAPPIGTVVMAVCSDQQPVGIGVVAAELAAIPRERGELLLETFDPGDGKGVQISKEPSRVSRQNVFQVSDRITHLEGHPTRDGAEFVNQRDLLLDDVTRSVGDHLIITIVRNGQTMQIETPIVSQGEPSYRFRGFSKVYAHDVLLERKFAGTLLVSASGEVVGLTIVAANRDSLSTCYALPIEVVQQAIVKLRAKARFD